MISKLRRVLPGPRYDLDRGFGLASPGLQVSPHPLASLLPMTGYKLSPSYKANIDNINYHVSMGATAEAVSSKYKISREQADAFSFSSHKKAGNAIDKGFFKEEIVPIKVDEVFVKDGKRVESTHVVEVDEGAVSYTHLTLPTILACRSRWSPYH